jgi:hypothetical protein
MDETNLLSLIRPWLDNSVSPKILPTKQPLILFSSWAQVSSGRPATQPKDAEYSSSLAESIGAALWCMVSNDL